MAPAPSAVCHKNDPLIYWRCVPVLPKSPVTTVLLLLFTFLTFTSKFHLMKLLHGFIHHSVVLHRATRTVPLHMQACSPTAQTGPQSHRTNVCDRNVLFIYQDVCALKQACPCVRLSGTLGKRSASRPRRFVPIKRSSEPIE